MQSDSWRPCLDGFRSCGCRMRALPFAKRFYRLPPGLQLDKPADLTFRLLFGLRINHEAKSRAGFRHATGAVAGRCDSRTDSGVLPVHSRNARKNELGSSKPIKNAISAYPRFVLVR